MSEMADRLKAILLPYMDDGDGMLSDKDMEADAAEATREVLEAMREPPADMVEGGIQYLPELDGYPEDEEILKVWRGMLDAALKP